MEVSGTGIGKYIYAKTKTVLCSNYVNVLLFFIPLGIVAGIQKWSDVSIFVLNFLAIIPLAALLSFATEELALQVGETLGGLMNATFGNAIELIVSTRRLTRFSVFILTVEAGEHSCLVKRRNSHCTGQHAW